MKESDCEVCQCIDNYYLCDTSLCSKNLEKQLMTKIVPTESNVMIVKSTVTPPEECDESR